MITPVMQRLVPGFLVGTILAGVAFVALALLISPHDAPGWETDLVETATDTPRPLGAVAQMVMQLGTQPTIVLTAVLAYLVAKPRDLRWRAAAAVLVAGVVVRLTTTPLKELVSRGRPEGVHVRDSTADGFGFPSGHAAIAFVLAAVVAVYLPRRWRVVPFLLAAVVAFARLYVGVHYPLDVVGGALWGVAVGGIVLALPPFAPFERKGSGQPRLHM